MLTAGYHGDFIFNSSLQAAKNLSGTGWSQTQLKLVFHQFIIIAPSFYQVLMFTLLNNPPAINYNNLISILNRTEPVGYHHHRLISEKLLQVTDDCLLIFGIKGTGAFIDKKEFRISVNCPCDQPPLFLTTAEGMAL